MRFYWKTYPLKKRSLAPRETSGNKNFSNPSGIIKIPLTNIEPRSMSIFSHIILYLYMYKCEIVYIYEPGCILQYSSTGLKLDYIVG